MSVDLAGWINYAITGVVFLILAFGITRALEIRRAFVNPIFRSRATWMVLLMLVIIIVNIVSLFPVPDTGLASLAGFLPFLALILVIYLYVDGSVLVAMETDFFHRESFGWSKARWPVGICLFASMVVLVVVSLIVPATAAIPFWDVVAENAAFAVIPIILAYCTVALVVGARRSANRSLRKSILFFGIALSTLVLTLIATFPLAQGSLAYVILDQGTSLVAVYLLYLSVSSLSPLARKIEA